MNKFSQKRFVFRRNILGIIGLCLSIYFCYHLIAGQRGYFSLLSLESQIEQASIDYTTLKQQREAVEKRVVMMRPGSIDRDLLEERARYVLGYKYADELILPQSRS